MYNELEINTSLSIQQLTRNQSASENFIVTRFDRRSVICEAMVKLKPGPKWPHASPKTVDEMGWNEESHNRFCGFYVINVIKTKFKSILRQQFKYFDNRKLKFNNSNFSFLIVLPIVTY